MERHEVQRCGIARHLGQDIPCPPGGCRLLLALGETPRVAGDPSPAERLAERWGMDPDLIVSLRSAVGDIGDEALCPVEAIAARSGYEEIVLRTLDAVRQDLDRSGEVLPVARARRTRADRHEQALARWPVRG